MTNPGKGRKTIGLGFAVALLVLIALAVAGCGSSSDSSAGSSGGGKLDVVGYSPPEAVYEEALEPGFEGTSAGADVSFSNSFGASGDQSRAVEAGQPASVVHFAQGGDMIRLVESGQVAPDWDKNQYKGIAQDSVVVMTVRKGNPEGLESLDDLLTKDVEIVTPNPFSSGAARWNIMAIYGSTPPEGKYPQQGLDPANDQGEDVNYVIPRSTILIETPIAVTKDAPEAAQKFLDNIWSDAGQELWAENGYRPGHPRLVGPKQLPTPH